MADLHASNADEIAEIIQTHHSKGSSLEVIGKGSKRTVGRPLACESILDLSGLSGINFYEPSELAISMKAGTALDEVERLLAEHQQCFVFDPPRYGRLLGRNSNETSMGGLVAGNLAGPIRVSRGALRDHLLGVEAINGAGERIKSGGRVMKNVTGYDIAKLIAGSWGTLAVMTDVTLKVMPQQEAQTTLCLKGLDARLGVKALCQALGSPFDVVRAAYLPEACVQASSNPAIAAYGCSLALVQLEGFASSVRYRQNELRDVLADIGQASVYENDDTALWASIRDVADVLPNAEIVWKLSVTPSHGPLILEGLIKNCGGRGYLDWGGGLVWYSPKSTRDPQSQTIRGLVADYGGHALLLKAPEAMRAQTEIFQPASPPIAQLYQGIKRAFDPKGILAPGRQFAGI